MKKVMKINENIVELEGNDEMWMFVNNLLEEMETVQDYVWERCFKCHEKEGFQDDPGDYDGIDPCKECPVKDIKHDRYGNVRKDVANILKQIMEKLIKITSYDINDEKVVEVIMPDGKRIIGNKALWSEFKAAKEEYAIMDESEFGGVSDDGDDEIKEEWETVCKLETFINEKF